MELKKLNESEIAYRTNGNSGPKYLMRGPRSDFGLVQLQPGEDFQSHYHSAIEENFFTLEGTCELYIDQQKWLLTPGDFIHVPPKNAHYLVNRGTVPWKAVFSKAPFDVKDKVDTDRPPSAT